MASKRQTAEHLARALLAGIWEKDAMMQRARRALMGPLPWLDTLIPTILTCFGKKRRPLPAKLRNFILCSPGFSTAWMNPAGRPCIDSYPLEPALAEQPEAWCSGLELPQLTTPADVAEWLGVTTGELDWFADVPGRQG
ncbi:MAG: hypothetical protein GY934_00535, partial [Gammaproteobacteria bacterium]|nr:hypothetical protein [Gammaproteobacteria bacterium]